MPHVSIDLKLTLSADQYNRLVGLAAGYGYNSCALYIEDAVERAIENDCKVILTKHLPAKSPKISKSHHAAPKTDPAAPSSPSASSVAPAPRTRTPIDPGLLAAACSEVERAICDTYAAVGIVKKSLRTFTAISNKLLTAALHKLVKQGRIRLVGKGRGAKYWPNFDGDKK